MGDDPDKRALISFPLVSVKDSVSSEIPFHDS